MATVEHFMHAGQDLPTVTRQDPLRKVIVTMSQKRLGAALVIGEEKELLGLLTDGDLRRTFESCPAPLDESVEDWMTVQPQTIGTESLAVDAIKLMEAKKITSLPVVDQNGRLIGLVHLHDLIRAGLA